MKGKTLMHFKTLWLITVRTKGNKGEIWAEKHPCTIPAATLNHIKFGGREEIRLSGALQDYKQNHGVGRYECYWDRMDRFFIMFKIEVTEFTY